MKKQIPFGVLLLRYFGVTVAAVMIVLGSCAYIGMRWLVAELSNNVGDQSVQLVQARVHQYIDGVSAIVRTLGALQKFDTDTGKSVADHHQLLWEQLWSALRDAPAIEALHVADTRGSYVQVRRYTDPVTQLIDRRVTGGAAQGRESWLNRDADFKVVGAEKRDGTFDPRTRPWFRDATREMITQWSEVSVSAASGQPVVVVTVPVGDAKGGVARVVGASVPLGRLSELLVQARPTPSSIMLIMNRRGDVIANAVGGASRPVIKGDRFAVADDLAVKGLTDALGKIQPATPSPTTVNMSGVSYHAYARAFGGHDWSAVVLIPDADLLDQFSGLLAIAMIVVVAVFLGAVVALLRLSASLSRPLARLVSEANHIRAFELDAFRGVRSRIDEVAQLSSAIESAVEALKGFKRYVPAELVRQMLASPEFARVGGREVELTIMFTDIFSFTALAERLSPKDLTSQISEYLELMTSVIMKHGGTVDKYIGDAVMSFWGAPVECEDGPCKACLAALECQERLIELNARWAREGRPQVRTGIGINTARVVVGNFGSSDRLNYSLLGDGVNLAARLEKLNREYQTLILLSESTLNLTAGRFESRLVGSVALRGRAQTVRVHELIRVCSAVIAGQ